MPILENPKHERFAQLVAEGKTGAEAVRTISGKKRAGDREAASRWLEITAARVKELKAASATSTTLTMQERREWLARVVRCDLAKIDLTKDGDLVQELIREEGSDGEKGIVKIKLPGKRECIHLDAELAGELEGKVKVSGTIEHHHSMSEDRRKELIQKRRLALQGTN